MLISPSSYYSSSSSSRSCYCCCRLVFFCRHSFRNAGKMIKNEDEEQFFYESLDRILSSYSSSTSNSDDDEDGGGCPNFQQITRGNRNSVHNYDVWASAPSSVEERRSRLLLAMGIADDGGRRRSDLPYGLDRRDSYRDGAESVSRSRSGCGSLPHAVDDELNLSSLSCYPSATSLPSAEDAADPTSSNASLSSRSDSPSSAMANNFSRGDSATAVFVVWPASDRPCSGEVAEEQGCTIKNLDNGEEFVLNDGVWKRLREVGRGKQLTMEEFDLCVGLSPIVQELMRRQNVEDGGSDLGAGGSSGELPKQKKKGGWFKSIREVASSVRGHRERKSSDERDTSSEKGGRRSSSATDDSQEMSFHGPERVRVHQYGKAFKELSGLYKSQEIQGHKGSIWCIKFSLDGLYLASAGEDCVIHVWQVLESERKGELLMEKVEDGNSNSFLSSASSEQNSTSSLNLDSVLDKKRRGRPYLGRKSLSLDHVSVPETVFALSEKPIRSLHGHLKDVLDISWSKSQYLLSSSMDKTVRLWHLSSQSCLKVFSHSDYVTCIQFNPMDDRYFISGSLDAKVRTWSIPDRQVVDWNDLHEMITAVCYTPDGQGALVGSYKGNCWLYKTCENKLQQKTEINLHNRKKKSNHKKITGFEFSPGSSSEVIITSADSRVRVVDGVNMIHKFKGFRNTSSQISASPTANGRYIVCASEDSNVYVWRYKGESRTSKGVAAAITRSYEHFHCRDVAVAVPWPGSTDPWGGVHRPNPEEPAAAVCNHQEAISTAHHPPTPVDDSGGGGGGGGDGSQLHSGGSNSYLVDRIWATWPTEEKFERLSSASRNYYYSSTGLAAQTRAPAWGMVIVTAGLRGEIRAFQNFGAPLRA